MRRVVLIQAAIDKQFLEQLQSISPDLAIEYRPQRSNEAVPDDIWQEVEVLYTMGSVLPTPEQAPQLRWVQLYSAGTDRALNHPLFSTSVIFTTASGIHAIPIAEYTFTMVQAWFHRFPQLLTWQQQGQWPTNEERYSLSIEELHGKTIGIVGYGSIGRQVARLASGYGMRILAMQRGSDHRDRGFSFPGVGDPSGTLPHHYYTPDQLHEMLKQSDVVVIAVPSTPQTQGMFDEAAFEAMKETAFLVNIARGNVCDETALVHALEAKRIDGAALDVFEQEPLPSDNPLWHLPNVFLSPHISGLTPHYNERVATIFEANLRRYLAHEPLYNTVDKERGY